MDGPEVETSLVDLSEISLGHVLHNFDALQGAVELLLNQLERPRYNIGSTGPPGRAD
jgi:hypothetical protein